MQTKHVAWLAAATDIAIVIGFGMATPGHDPLRHYISTLGAVDAPHRVAYSWAGLLAGTLHLWLFARVAHVCRTRWMVAALGFFVAFTLAHMTAAVAFPCDPACIHTTVPGTIHYSLGFAAFLAYGLGVISWSIGAYRQNWSTAIHWPALAIVITALWLLVADATQVFHGAAERANVLALAWWTVTLPSSLPDYSAKSNIA